MLRQLRALPAQRAQAGRGRGSEVRGPGREGIPGEIGRQVAVTCALAALGGVAVAVWPEASIGIIAMTAMVILLTRGKGLVWLFAVSLPILLLFYMFLGRGFAHIGVGPVYVGDVVLGLAILATLVSVTRIWLSARHLLLFLFMAWGWLCTAPYLPVYGLNSLRDATLWGYAAIGLAVSWTWTEPNVRRFLHWYRLAAVAFLVWVPVAAVLSLRFASSLPLAPGSQVPLLVVKGGDMSVHLAAVATLLIAQALPLSTTNRSSWALWTMWFFGVALSGAINRGGLVTAAVGSALALAVVSARRFGMAIAVLVLGVALGLLFNFQFSLGLTRDLSLTQIGQNIASIFGNTGGTNLQGTKDFRLAWWSDIANYTFDGPYFWTGKGFGINLADSDGFQVTPDHSLRDPHDVTFTVLARMGVPGLAIWLALQAAIGSAMLRDLRQARRAQQGDLQVWFALALVYWVAILVDSSFDPYLEGPQGSIWFWSIVGLSLVGSRVLQLRVASAGPERLNPRIVAALPVQT